jgi:hypothetical protein
MFCTRTSAGAVGDLASRASRSRFFSLRTGMAQSATSMSSWGSLVRSTTGWGEVCCPGIPDRDRGSSIKDTSRATMITQTNDR